MPLITRSPRGRLKILNFTSGEGGSSFVEAVSSASQPALEAIYGTSDMFGWAQSDLLTHENPKLFIHQNHAPVAPMTLAGLEPSAEDWVVDPNEMVAVSARSG